LLAQKTTGVNDVAAKSNQVIRESMGGDPFCLGFLTEPPTQRLQDCLPISQGYNHADQST